MFTSNHDDLRDCPPAREIPGRKIVCFKDSLFGIELDMTTKILIISVEVHTFCLRVVLNLGTNYS